MAVHANPLNIIKIKSINNTIKGINIGRKIKKRDTLIIPHICNSDIMNVIKHKTDKLNFILYIFDFI